MYAIQLSQSSNLQQILQQQSLGCATSSAIQVRQTQSESLDTILSSSGLSADQQASLKSDLQSALDDVFTTSSSFPPNPQDVKSAVDSVFSKYGLDAEQLSSKLSPSEEETGGLPGFGGLPPAGGPPPAGWPGSDCGTSSSDSSDSSSLNSSSDSTTSSTQGTTDQSSQLLDLLKQFLSQLSDQNSNQNPSQNTADYLFVGLVGFNAQA